MPLQTLPGATYVDRHLVHVDSSQQEPDSSADDYRYTFRLVHPLQHVMAIELAQFNILGFTAPTWAGPSNLLQAQVNANQPFTPSNSDPSNTRLDVVLEDETRAHRLSMLIDYDQAYIFAFIGFIRVGYSGFRLSQTNIIQAIFFDLLVRFVLFGASNPVVNSTNYTLGFTRIRDNNRTVFYLENNSVTGSFGYVTIRNRTGANARANAARVMGQEPNRDLESTLETGTLAGTVFGAASLGPLNGQPFSYIDVSIEEAGELVPLARIPVLNNGEGWNAPCNRCPRLVRFLRTPVPLMEEIRIVLRLYNRSRPAAPANIGHELTFVVYTLDQIDRPRSWLNQRFVLD